MKLEQSDCGGSRSRGRRWQKGKELLRSRRDRREGVQKNFAGGHDHKADQRVEPLVG